MSPKFLDLDFNKSVDITPLAIFRICFGFLLTAEAWGAILTGWVKSNLVEPSFQFTFIGFEFLQSFLGEGMYYWYFIMGAFGFMVMIGRYYRIAIWSYSLLWLFTYLMQKTSYNNHYYLLVLLNFTMCFMPAHKSLSLDVKYKTVEEQESMPNVIILFFIFQLWIVYTYASIAKMYPDWFNAIPIRIWFNQKSDFWLIGDLLSLEWFQYAVAYGGILFDLLIIPALIWKKTRYFAFWISIGFHLFNEAVFHIGIFPFLMIATSLFFFEPEQVRKLFLKKKPLIAEPRTKFQLKKWHQLAIIAYLLIQFALPLRHWFYKGDVLITEEGHRLSWRMMLRTKAGSGTFYIQEVGSRAKKQVDLNDFLNRKQKAKLFTQPDFIWQFAQHLKEVYAKKGIDIAVYCEAKKSINHKKFEALIDKNVDLAAVEWKRFGHSDWILLPQE